MVDVLQTIFNVSRHLWQVKDRQGQGSRNNREAILELHYKDQITKETNYDRWERRQDLNTGSNQIGQWALLGIL